MSVGGVLAVAERQTLIKPTSNDPSQRFTLQDKELNKSPVNIYKNSFNLPKFVPEIKITVPYTAKLF